MSIQSFDPTGTHRLRRRLIAVAIAAGLIVATAAALPDAGAAANAKRAGIQYTSKTVLIPTATIKSQLLSVSKDGSIYTFKSKNGKIGKLKAGKVMLLEHLAVRDVTKAKTSHGHYVVTTDPAELTDLIRNGTLSWNKALDFTDAYGVSGVAVPANVARGASANGVFAPSVASQFGMVPLQRKGGITFKGKAHGFNYSMGFKDEGSSVESTISITRSTPIDMEVKITGTLHNLKSSGKFAVKNGKASSAKMVANNLHGDFKLTYTAKPGTAFGFDDNGQVPLITIPGEIAVPFFVGPVPFFLGIKVGFTVSAGFSNFNQEVSGSYTFTYDGASGFSMTKSGATSAAGAVKALAEIIQNAIHSVGTGPFSWTFGAQMPKVELGLGIKGLNVAGSVTLAGSTQMSTYGSGCDSRKMEILGVAGAEANFFGFSASLASAKLFDKTIYASRPRGCA